MKPVLTSIDFGLSLGTLLVFLVTMVLVIIALIALYFNQPFGIDVVTIILVALFTIIGVLGVLYCILMIAVTDTCESLEPTVVQLAENRNNGGSASTNIVPVLKYYFYEEGTLEAAVKEGLNVDLDGLRDQVSRTVVWGGCQLRDVIEVFGVY